MRCMRRSNLPPHVRPQRPYMLAPIPVQVGASARIAVASSNLRYPHSRTLPQTHQNFQGR